MLEIAGKKVRGLPAGYFYIGLKLCYILIRVKYGNLWNWERPPYVYLDSGERKTVVAVARDSERLHQTLGLESV